MLAMFNIFFHLKLAQCPEAGITTVELRILKLREVSNLSKMTQDTVYTRGALHYLDVMKVKWLMNGEHPEWCLESWNIISNAYIFAILITLLFIRVDDKRMFIVFYATHNTNYIVIFKRIKETP